MPEPPAAPINIQITQDIQKITIEWEDDAGGGGRSGNRTATSFNIYMATESGITRDNYMTLDGGMKLESVTSPHTIDNLVMGETYYLVVTGVNDDGEGPTSDEFEIYAKTYFDFMAGEWTIRLNEPFSSCNSLDLNEYEGDGYNDHWLLNLLKEGSFEYIYLDWMADESDFSIVYQVTDNNDPFSMEREMTVEGSDCTWFGTRIYELTFLSKDHLVGTQVTNYVGNFSYCENCQTRVRTEIKRGIYGSIHDAPF